jgi:hypothetical protein
LEAKRVSQRLDTDASAGYNIVISVGRLQARLEANREYARTATRNGKEPLIRAVRDPILVALDRAESLLRQAESAAQEAAAHLDEAVELLRDAAT